MIKKLIPFICCAAVLLLCATALTAQESAMSQATKGRFTTDVDNAFSVNDWADVEFSKWFSYIKMQEVKLPTRWQTGLALQLPNTYLGFYYEGTFITGKNEEGTITVGVNGPTTGTEDIASWSSTWPGLSAYDVITRDNLYKVLIGAGKNSFLVSVVDEFKFSELPTVYAGSVTSLGGTSIPADSVGYYRNRSGKITPALTWGAAQDINLGNYTTRPSAKVEMEVGFGDEELILYTPEGKTLTLRDGVSNNYLIPTLFADTGAIKMWSGDWGTVWVGASEQFSIKITGEGSGSAVPWENKLTLYSAFSYDPAEYFSIGAFLGVPVWFGWESESFIGVGAKEAGATPALTIGSADEDYPVLNFGFKLKGSILSKLDERIGLFDKLSLNTGVGVKLPAYLYHGTYTDTPASSIYTTTYTHEWFTPASVLQDFTLGLTFNITPNVVLDTVLKMGAVTETTILLSVKHNGPKKAANAQQ